MTKKEFSVIIWGARGTVPAPGPETNRYGGNTACVEVRCGERLLVFDAGTGVRRLGNKLMMENTRRLDLFFTHCHYDHIEGLPFFAPLFSADWQVTMWSGHCHGKMTTQQIVSGYMSKPYFPIDPRYFAARIGYRDFASGDVLDLGDGIAVRTAKLNHPDGAVGYRVEFDGRSVCYVTDTEHIPGRPDRNVLALIEAADLVIYDAAYDDEDFAGFVGYGHSTWQEGVRLCHRANAGKLLLFHHRPTFCDQALDDVEARAGAMRPGTRAAREGMVLTP